MIRGVIKNFLKRLGYENILEADDGTSALEVLRREKVDFIISDWNMPQMSGLELLQTVRTSEEWKDLPFLMITGGGQAKNVLEAVKNKVNNYMVKPFTLEILMGKISKIFEGK